MTIVLPEGHDPRVVAAAVRVEEEQLASAIVLGNAAQVRRIGASVGVDSASLEIVDPRESEMLPEMASLYEELRAHRGITRDDAELRVCDPVLFGAFLVSNGLADGCVAGAATATSDVLRAALHAIGVAAGAGAVSSSFLMIVPDDVDVPEHVLLFADCAVLPRPGRRQLAEIAVATAATRSLLVGDEPRVAMLSFSTKGSGSDGDVDRVVRATKLVCAEHPTLIVDGELQADAALLPSVASRKAGDSEVAGRANVLIFPDLDAANISYKLVQRLCRARAVGPIVQGLAKPVNDLSRGASVEDIVDLVAVTAVQAQALGWPGAPAPA
jgi:phosphate acetyltransferase